MKKFLLPLILISICSVMTLSAQTFEDFKRQQKSEFRDFRSKKQKEYDEFRKRINTEFAQMMKGKWTEMEVREAEPQPALPEPPQPVVKPQEDESKPIPELEKEELEVKAVVKQQPAYKAPEPVTPIQKPQIENKPQWLVLFHDTPCNVHLDKDLKFKLADATENAAAAAWEILSNGKYDDAISDCLEIRKNLNLSDWGYISFLSELTKSFLGDGNEAVLMQMFLLTQSGYKVRIARTDQRLVLLVPFSDEVYQYSFIRKDDLKYYVLAQVPNGSAFYVFDRVFPKERIATLRTNGVPNLAYSAGRTRKLTSQRFPQMSFEVTTNQNLIDFYNTCPTTDHWDYYAKTSLSKEVKNKLYPQLQKQLQGKSKKEATQMLLNFVQTAFEYQTDQQQFGYERPLFADESLYYPYCDCEDRSILFSVLVKEVLGLDVVLLHYPEHLATAVCIENEAIGTYLKVDGKTFTVCDPTYIGAAVGECMTRYRNTNPEVIKM